MNDPHIVMDWNMTKAYGPFHSKGDAEKWLSDQGITEDMYEQQEVSILSVLSTIERLEIIG